MHVIQENIPVSSVREKICSDVYLHEEKKVFYNNTRRHGLLEQSSPSFSCEPFLRSRQRREKNGLRC